MKKNFNYVLKKLSMLLINQKTFGILLSHKI